MQGTLVWSLEGEDPTYLEQLSLWSPSVPKRVPHNERKDSTEKPADRKEEQTPSRSAKSQRKSVCGHEDPIPPKNNKK